MALGILDLGRLPRSLAALGDTSPEVRAFLDLRKQATALAKATPGLGMARNAQTSELVPKVGRAFAVKMIEFLRSQVASRQGAIDSLDEPFRSRTRRDVAAADTELAGLLVAAADPLTGEQSVYFWRSGQKMAVALGAVGSAIPNSVWQAIGESLSELPETVGRAVGGAVRATAGAAAKGLLEGLGPWLVLGLGVGALAFFWPRIKRAVAVGRAVGTTVQRARGAQPMQGLFGKRRELYRGPEGDARTYAARLQADGCESWKLGRSGGEWTVSAGDSCAPTSRAGLRGLRRRRRR